MMIKEAQELRGLVELHLRRGGGRAHLAPASVIPRTEDETVGRSAESQVTLDRRELIGAVEPSAVSIDGSTRPLEVTDEGVRAERVRGARRTPRDVVAVGDVPRPGVRIVIVRVIADGRGEQGAV